jgi:hypothetical protein
VKDWFLLMQVPKFKKYFSLSDQRIMETDSIRENPEAQRSVRGMGRKLTA